MLQMCTTIITMYCRAIIISAWAPQSYKWLPSASLWCTPLLNWHLLAWPIWPQFDGCHLGSDVGDGRTMPAKTAGLIIRANPTWTLCPSLLVCEENLTDMYGLYQGRNWAEIMFMQNFSDIYLLSHWINMRKNVFIFYHFLKLVA